LEIVELLFSAKEKGKRSEAGFNEMKDPSAQGLNKKIFALN
jgi:hypothetical protein